MSKKVVSAFLAVAIILLCLSSIVFAATTPNPKDNVQVLENYEALTIGTLYQNGNPNAVAGAPFFAFSSDNSYAEIVSFENGKGANVVADPGGYLHMSGAITASLSAYDAQGFSMRFVNNRNEILYTGIRFDLTVYNKTTGVNSSISLLPDKGAVEAIEAGSSQNVAIVYTTNGIQLPKNFNGYLFVDFSKCMIENTRTPFIPAYYNVINLNTMVFFPGSNGFNITLDDIGVITGPGYSASSFPTTYETSDFSTWTQAQVDSHRNTSIPNLTVTASAGGMNFNATAAISRMSTTYGVTDQNGNAVNNTQFNTDALLYRLVNNGSAFNFNCIAMFNEQHAYSECYPTFRLFNSDYTEITPTQSFVKVLIPAGFDGYVMLDFTSGLIFGGAPLADNPPDFSKLSAVHMYTDEATSFTIKASYAGAQHYEPSVATTEYTQKAKVSDYTYMWWKNGQNASDTGNAINIQTGNYGVQFDYMSFNMTRIGNLNGVNSSQAQLQSNSVIDNLNTAGSRLFLDYGTTSSPAGIPDTTKLQTSSDTIERLIASGQVMQNFDITNIRFKDQNNVQLPFDARFEVNAMADFFSIIIDFLSDGSSISGMNLHYDFDLGSGQWQASWLDNDSSTGVLTLKKSTGEGFTFVTPTLPDGSRPVTIERANTEGMIRINRTNFTLPAFRDNIYAREFGLGLIVIPSDNASPEDGRKFIEPEKIIMNAKNIMPLNNVVQEVTYDGLRGIYVCSLTDNYGLAANSDILERVPFTIQNTSNSDLRVPFVFERYNDGKGIGLVPLLRDTDGTPTGMPMQISKNWHSLGNNQYRLYDGSWSRAYGFVEVPANSAVGYEFTYVYEQWGNASAASHAQLCLIGFGGNELWEESAIGTWSESICYSPDLSTGSFIADVRSTLTLGVTNNAYEWQNNVGGGNFLFYTNSSGARQNLKNVKVNYASHGPNLTKVIYTGITADEKMQVKITAQLQRCDDIVRAYYTLEYDVLADLTFNRMAFFQMGTTGYNEGNPNILAYGNASGLTDEYAPTKGGEKYQYKNILQMNGISLSGTSPWVSLHQASPFNSSETGSWPNRAMVIREYEAKINGSQNNTPNIRVYGSSNNHHNTASFYVELGPKGNVSKLKAGDYLNATVEFMVIPRFHNDYFGTNDQLKSSLIIDQNTYKPALFQAIGNNIIPTVTKGTLVSTHPTVVQADSDGAIVSLQNGVGYVPITFTGLTTYKGWALEENDGTGVWTSIAESQEVHGNDYYQTEYDPVTNTYSLTFNVYRNRTLKPTAQFRLVQPE